MSIKRRMHLVAYLKTGPTANHAGGWRHPASDLNNIFEPERYEHLARVLESARFDAGFFADTFGIPDLHGNHFETYLRLGGQISYLDPLAVLPLHGPCHQPPRPGRDALHDVPDAILSGAHAGVA